MQVNDQPALVKAGNNKVPRKFEKIGVDFLAGSFAGFSSTLCGHPLDTIKVRMQVLNSRFWTCCRSMVNQEGVSSLFKGVQSPLMSAPIMHAVSFGSYELSKRIIGIQRGEKVSFYKGLMAGGVAGFFYAAVSTPIELIKCRQQMEGAGEKGFKTTGSFAMIYQIIRNEGFLGLYRGYLMTCLRDIPGGAVQFGAYELGKNLLGTYYRESTYTNFIAGGFAKFATLFVCYPQDLIKTRLQCKDKHQSMFDVIREVWLKSGGMGFWRGTLPSILRTLLSGAVSFSAYEEAKKYLLKLQ